MQGCFMWAFPVKVEQSLPKTAVERWYELWTTIASPPTHDLIMSHDFQNHHQLLFKLPKKLSVLSCEPPLDSIQKGATALNPMVLAAIPDRGNHRRDHHARLEVRRSSSVPGTKKAGAGSSGPSWELGAWLLRRGYPKWLVSGGKAHEHLHDLGLYHYFRFP